MRPDNQNTIPHAAGYEAGHRMAIGPNGDIYGLREYNDDFRNVMNVNWIYVNISGINNWLDDESDCD